MNTNFAVDLRESIEGRILFYKKVSLNMIKCAYGKRA